MDSTNPTERLSAIQNFLRLSDDLATSGQPFADQLEWIAQAGFQTVINLSSPAAWDYLPDEGERVAALGLEYVPIPVDWTQPAQEDLDAFFEALDRRAGRRVYVHCARNMRVSAFVFLYRVLRTGMPVELAQADLLRIWIPEDIWLEFIQERVTGFPL